MRGRPVPARGGSGARAPDKGGSLFELSPGAGPEPLTDLPGWLRWRASEKVSEQFPCGAADGAPASGATR